MRIEFFLIDLQHIMKYYKNSLSFFVTFLMCIRYNYINTIINHNLKTRKMKTTDKKIQEIVEANPMYKSFQKYFSASQEGRNDYEIGCIQTANAILPVLHEFLMEMVSKDQEITKLKDAINVLLIGVKNQDITIYPNSDQTPDYIQLLENLTKQDT